MKRYCKKIIINKEFIKECAYECLSDKWNRNDGKRFLNKYRENNKNKTENEILDDAADEIEKEIRNRDLQFENIRYSLRIDHNSGKTREIGSESIKQQICNYVAVRAMDELFSRKIGRYQCASIPGRGQVYGKQTIEKWIRKNPTKSKYAAKGDVKKCYPSINKDRLMDILKKNIKNDDVIYLVQTIINTYKNGLSIGSYLSQWLCNYYLSYAYRFAEQQLFKTRKTKYGSKRIRLINHVLFYMDDILIIGSRKSDVKAAMKKLIKFMNNDLGLDVKSNWSLFLIDRKDAEGKRRGNCIDMMGYKIYRDHTEVRRNIFLKARRTYLKIAKKIKQKTPIPIHLAYRAVSYYGWFKHSDSKHFIKKYQINDIIKAAKRRISYESKVRNKTKEMFVANNQRNESRCHNLS